MQNRKKDFINEITNNFSQLFVEAYFLKFLADFNTNNILKDTGVTYKILNEKIIKNLTKKLKLLGYNNSEIKNIFI